MTNILHRLEEVISTATGLTRGASTGHIRESGVGDVNVGQYAVPLSTDLRGPCPALNTLANHGLLPRDGRGITATMLVDAVREGFNMDATVLISAVYPQDGQGQGVRTADEVTPDGTPFLNLDDLAKHSPSKMEHDVSLTRKDFSIGDNKRVDPALVDALIASSSDGISVNADDLASFRVARYKDSKVRNPDLLFGAKQLVTACVESAVLLNTLGRDGKIPIEHIKSFFLREEIPANYLKPKQLIDNNIVYLSVAEQVAKWEWHRLVDPKITLPIDDREYELVPIPSTEVDMHITVGNASNVNLKVPSNFLGAFYTDGNPLPDEVFSLANGVWSETENAYYFPVYGASTWTYDNTPTGRALYEVLKVAHVHYKATFDKSGVATIIPVGKITGTAHHSLVFDIPEWCIEFTVVPTEDPNVFTRKTSLFHREPSEYKLVRILNADGSRTPEYESVYLKNLNNPIQVLNAPALTHLANTQLVAVLKNQPDDPAEKYLVEITSSREFYGLDFTNLQITILHSAAQGANAKVFQTVPLRLKKQKKTIFDITKTARTFDTFAIENTNFRLHDNIHALAIDVQGTEGLSPVSYWFIETIKIKLPKGSSGFDTIYFPIHVSNDDAVPPLIKKLRKEDLDTWRNTYTPKYVVEGMPIGMGGVVEDLPRDELYPMSQYKFIREFNSSGVLKAFLTVEHNFSAIKDLDTVFRDLKKPEVSKDWKSDSVFGSQFITGVNPVTIQAVSTNVAEFPPNCFQSLSVSALSKVPALKNKIVGDEVSKGAFVLIDYRAQLAPFVKSFSISMTTDSITGGTLVAPVALFYHNSESFSLVPVAIQLEEGGEVFYPLEDAASEDNTWLLAKMWLGLADSHVHELNEHLLKTHLAIEPFGLALKRQLSPQHPIRKLMDPHFHSTPQINAEGRGILLNIISDAMSIGDSLVNFFIHNYKKWTFAEMNPVKQLEKRGFDGAAPTSTLNRPGNFPWAEDARDLFEVISKHMGRFVDLFYKVDENVAADTELQAWIYECSQFHEGKNVPEKFETKNELRDALAMIAWTASAQHSTLNYPQYDTYGYPPNRSFKTQRIPLQTREEPVTEETLASFLPTKNDVLLGLNFIAALAAYEKDDVFLGDRPYDWFGPLAQDANNLFYQFKIELAEFDERVKLRNQNPGRRENPYEWMLSNKIVNSTKI
ncbi:Arachidonate 5-lipoxygenase [Physocladia obscura]|uniref:Manganese lipoxygenase n=1 Tax=Physocladia obscura TaxID=109957 RepID=A0AAD5XEW7_9FUNG|nr:Arachidonate 5-lipoxygenase [Physocladia obscura]